MSARHDFCLYFASFWQPWSLPCLLRLLLDDLPQVPQSPLSSTSLAFLNKLFGYSFLPLTLCRKSESLSSSMLKAELVGYHVQLRCFFTDFPKLPLFQLQIRGCVAIRWWHKAQPAIASMEVISSAQLHVTSVQVPICLENPMQTPPRWALPLCQCQGPLSPFILPFLLFSSAKVSY